MREEFVRTDGPHAHSLRRLEVHTQIIQHHAFLGSQPLGSLILLVEEFTALFEGNLINPPLRLPDSYLARVHEDIEHGAK